MIKITALLAASALTLDAPDERHERPGGQGLLNMRDRAADIGAELSLRSTPGHGTTVQLWMPLTLTMLEPSR